MNPKALDQISRANVREFQKPTLSEADLERQCSDFLALDGWRALKTDPVSRREWGKGFGEKGMADRLYIRYDWPGIERLLDKADANGHMFTEADISALAQVLWIEWKRRGGRPKPHQRAWIMSERARGALVLVAGEDFAAAFEAFAEWYRLSGLMRRAGL